MDQHREAKPARFNVSAGRSSTYRHVIERHVRIQLVRSVMLHASSICTACTLLVNLAASMHSTRHSPGMSV